MPLKISKKLLVIASAVFVVWIISSALLPFYGRKLSADTIAKFYQRSPEAIVVYTGDRGRIERAFELAKKMPGSKLLITGVHNNNSLKTIASSQIDSLDPEVFVKKYDHLVDIDYEAKNTIENVLATLIYSRQNKMNNNLIIVSSDYHIPRICLINQFLKEPKDNAILHYISVETTETNFYNLKRYLKESLRLVKALIVLLFWD